MEHIHHLQMSTMIHVAGFVNKNTVNCPEFVNKSLDEKKHFIVQNRSCWNCLSKKPFCSIEQVTINSHSVKPHIFLQVIPVTISNGSRTVTTNAFLCESDSTLISKGLAEKLNVYGATKTLKIRNVLNNEMP